jgi:hypothetical protein
MPLARRYILERLLNERETGATRNRLKCHSDLGLVTAFAVIALCVLEIWRRALPRPFHSVRVDITNARSAAQRL